MDRARRRSETAGTRGLIVTAGVTTALLALLAHGRPAVSQVPVSAADINCDGASSAADLSAIIAVSYDGSVFPDCTAADPFRDRRLAEEDLLAVQREIFHFFDTPLTPTITGTPTISGTPTETRTVTATFDTRTPTRTRTVTATRTVTVTRTVTRTTTPSQTRTASITATATPTATPTQTLTPSVTRTPTGIAFRLAGDWSANWENTICFLDGQPFANIQDTTYRVTASNNRLDIVASDGTVIGRGLSVGADGSVDPPPFTIPTGQCQVSGRVVQFEFDYFFRFNPNGTGAAAAEWSFGKDSFCAVCTPVFDEAVLGRVRLP